MNEPLARTEVRAGLARLNATPFMVWNTPFSDYPHNTMIGDQSAQFAIDMMSGISEAFARKHGIPTDRDVSGIISWLAAALVLSRLTPEEAFRVGTSEEALRLFTEKGDWRSVARAVS